MKYEDLVAAALAALNKQNSAAEGHRDPPNPKRNFEIADERKAGAVDSKAADKRGRKRIKKVEHRFPVEPQIIQICKKAKAYVNHSYCDFSSVPPEMDYKDVEAIEEMSFSRKLHDILSKKEFQECISWLPHGRAFKKFMFPRAWNKPRYWKNILDTIASLAFCVSSQIMDSSTSHRDEIATATTMR